MAKSPELLKETLEHEKERIFRIAWRMCGNPDDAEEVLQETALSALKNWDQFRGEAQIMTWIYRIASNTCLSRQRKQNAMAVESSSLEVLGELPHDSSVLHPTDWSLNPLTQALNDELRTALDHAISRLPDLYRIVFLMRDIEGLSTEETSNALGISATNVKVRLHRARMYLRDQLESYVHQSKSRIQHEHSI